MIREDPPKPYLRRGKYAGLAAAIRAEPGVWFRVLECDSAQLASARAQTLIRAHGLRAVARTLKENGQKIYAVYARTQDTSDAR